MTDEHGDPSDPSAGNPAGDRDGAAGASGADRLTAPADDARVPRLPFPVVGIGASAGGLEAYTEFLQSCPDDAGLAYVLVQHLPPDRESLLTELLARHTRMPVREVEDGQAVEADRVYVIRPGHTLTIRDGRLHLGPELAARGHGRPVDDFFRSLAEEQQQRAVAVVFSGMGSNGTAGAEAVKAVGGLVIAQEPDSAKFPAMPRSLIDAHLPDYILRPAEVPEALAKYAGHPYSASDAPAPTPRDEQALADVLAVLRTRTRHDFTGYRKPTLLRRVRRRMGLGQFATPAEYVRALRQTPAEVTALADDLLIHVTGFFRDPDAWESLQEKVIRPLVADRPDGAEVRCWVSACATGEEAYTLAMLLVEAAEGQGKWFDVKVFATDMAERALGHARTGVFPNGIESEVAPERLARFFDKDDSFYRVKKELRERVIFAPQNVLTDPPFSRLDIATCRNLLIYLEPDTQRRVLAALHFGLREGGCLMLGTSESAAPADGDFEPIDKRYRLFRRVGPSRPGTLDLRAVAAALREARPPLPPPSRSIPTAAELVGRALLDWHTPAAVAVDAAGHVVHVHGDTSRYLTLPPGVPTHDLLSLANDAVRGAVRTALHKASDTQAPVTVRDGVIDTPDGRRRVEVGAAPLNPRPATPLYLVTFRELAEPPPPSAGGNGEPLTDGRLADELQRVRNELQSALEEMQSSNEELKASHEEATSLNEELQSTNEELETSKEEMQSLNEELVTVNAQLQSKMGELEGTANDLGSLLTSTDIAVLFLDPRFRIRRFTPAVKDLLDLIPSDVGRPLADLRRKFTDPDLVADAQAVLDRLIPVEREVASESGRAYQRRVLPYRTQDNRIDGVVVTFVDVTERRRVDAALRASERELATELDAKTRLQELSDRLLSAADLPAALGEVLDTAITLHAADRGTVQVYDPAVDGLRYAATRGFDPAVLAGFPFVCRDFHSTCAAAIRTGAPVIAPDIPADPRFADHAATAAALGYRAAFSFPLTTRRGEFLGVLTVHFREARTPADRELRWADLYALLAAHLIERARAEDALRASEERLRALFDTMGQGVAIMKLVRNDAGNVVDTQYLELNPAFERLTGFGRDVVAGRRTSEVFPSQFAAMQPRLATVQGTAGSERFESFVAEIGRWFSFHAAPFGGPDGFAVFFDDITERKVAEESVRQSEERLRLALAAARMGTWTWDPTTDVHVRDANLNRLLGQPPEGVRAPLADFLSHIHPDDRAGVRAAFDQAVQEGRTLTAEFRVVWPDGTVHWLRDQGDVFEESGTKRLSGACMDITDLKAAEEELRRGRDRLEERVAERTAELSAAVASLEAEMDRRRELAGRLATYQEDERRRMARELHDSVGQLLTALTLAVKAARDAAPLSPPTAARLDEVQRVADELGKTAHELAVRLRPTALDDLGLAAALAQYLNEWFARTGVAVDFDASAVEADRLPSDVETAFYRVVQEALTNVTRHARATRVSVTVSRNDGHAVAVVEDDGVGFDPDAGNGRLGLVGMRERVALLGGTLHIESAAGKGTAVYARVPVSGGGDD